jgi:hypothetical protein
MTLTSKVQVDTFPDSSVAVYTTVVVPMGKVSPGSCDDTRVTNPQLSVAIGAVQVATASHSSSATSSISATGQPEITGSTSSTTITLKVHVAIFPAGSVAVYKTAVVPFGKISPGLCELTKEDTEQLSEAVGGVHIAVPSHEALVDTTISARHPLITGSSSSVTTTSKLHVEIFP